MKMRVSVKAVPLALGAFMLVGVSSPAWAGNGEVDDGLGLSGIISGDYAHLGPNSGSDADVWGLGGGIKVGLSPNFSLEGSVGYHKYSAGGGSDIDSWDIQATGLYRTGGWKLGPVLAYEKNSVGSFDGEVKSWGGVVDYSALPHDGVWGWRVHAQGGAYDTNYGLDGNYWGAGLKLYPCPKFALSADVNYTRFSGFGSGHETDYGLSGEYQFGSSPFSVTGGYTRNDFSGGSFHIDTWSIGLSYRFNGPDKSSLQERHDNGPLPYYPAVSAVGLKF